LRSAADRISRLARLAPQERRLLLRAWWHLLLVDVSLRFLPVTLLLRRTGLRQNGVSPGVPLERIGWLLGVARRYSPVRTTCLKEALVLARAMRAEGLDAAVRIGVARRDGGLRAHAWVEHHGQVVFGAAETGVYTVLAAASGRRDAR
jgi:hypothetical protein